MNNLNAKRFNKRLMIFSLARGFLALKCNTKLTLTCGPAPVKEKEEKEKPSNTVGKEANGI